MRRLFLLSADLPCEREIKYVVYIGYFDIGTCSMNSQINVVYAVYRFLVNRNKIIFIMFIHFDSPIVKHNLYSPSSNTYKYKSSSVGVTRVSFALEGGFSVTIRAITQLSL